MANLFGIREDGTYRVEMIGASRVELTEGYVVATRSIAREADVPTLGELFGRWTDPDTGIVYWDAVEVIADQGTALDVAAARGELAVWDAAHGREISTARAFPTANEWTAAVTRGIAVGA